MPYTFYHLAIRIAHNSVAMHFSSVEFSFIDLSVVPFKCSSALHLTIFKWTCVCTVLGDHCAISDLEVSWKHSLVSSLSFPLFHIESAHAFHVSILKWTFIDFSIRPFEDCLIVILNTIHKPAPVKRPIGVPLFTLSIRLIVDPLPWVSEASSGDKSANSLQLSILYGASLIRTIRIEINSVIALNLSVVEGTLEIRPVIEIEFTKALGPSIFPSSFVVGIVFIDIVYWKQNTLSCRLL